MGHCVTLKWLSISHWPWVCVALHLNLHLDIVDYRANWLYRRWECMTSVGIDWPCGTRARKCCGGRTASRRPRAVRPSSPTPPGPLSASSTSTTGTCCVNSAPKVTTFSSCACHSTVPLIPTETKFWSPIIWTTASRFLMDERRASPAQAAVTFVVSDPVRINSFCRSFFKYFIYYILCIIYFTKYIAERYGPERKCTEQTSQLGMLELLGHVQRMSDDRMAT